MIRSSVRRRRETLAAVAGTIAPLLNRLVFTGRVAAELLETDESLSARRAPDLPAPAFDALTEVSLDRLGSELARAGLARDRRGADEEVWRHSSGASLRIQFAGGDEEGREIGPLDYALLMTNSVPIRAGVSVRISGAPALLAVWWDAHDRAGAGLAAEAILEDIVQLVALRPEIERELASAPLALRSQVGNHCAGFARDRAARWFVARALPDGQRFSVLVSRVLDRFARLGTAA